MPKGRVLAVDDQPYFRSFIEELLVEEGYQVRTANGAEAALAEIDRGVFDLVLTDVALPDMDGTAFVRAVRERASETEIVILTRVGDVKTAVEAMKVGAADYLLKPVDREVLQHVLAQVFERRRLEREHARLMQENLEYMGALSLYERSLGLLATLAVEPLAERILDGLCLDTNAQGAVIWLARHEDPDHLRLVAARGLVRLADEPEELDLDQIPPELETSSRNSASFVIEREHHLANRPVPAGALYVPLTSEGRLLGLARLTDKLDREAFHAPDRAAADKFGELAAIAVRNSLRFRTLERRSFKDPTTKAYTLAYFDDLVRNEIEKASRYGRNFSLLKIELLGVAPIRRRLAETQLAHWLEQLVYEMGRGLRSPDRVASESESRYRVLMPETDALGAAVLKRRLRESLERSEALQPEGSDQRAEILMAAATFPADGSDSDALAGVLNARIEETRASSVRKLGYKPTSFASTCDRLFTDCQPTPLELSDQVARFFLDEVGRRPQDRGLLFISPSDTISGTLREGFERLRGVPLRTEVVVVSERAGDALTGAPVTCVAPRRTGTKRPFLIYYGEGPAYAMLRAEQGHGDNALAFQTSDRALVEYLAFELQRDLGIALGA